MTEKVNFTKLDDLKLVGFKAAYKQQLENPSMIHGVSFDDRLAALIDAEQTHRQNVRRDGLLKRANRHIPPRRLGSQISCHALIETNCSSNQRQPDILA